MKRDSAGLLSGDDARTDQAREDGDARRAKRALVAYVQQELSAPAAAIVGYAEILMEDAVQADRAPCIADLRHILDASRALNRLVLSLVDPAAMHRIDGAAELAEFRRTLRHDLRTPINAIKGYAEMLREDAADTGAETFAADLDKLLKEATLILDRIDGLVTFSVGDAPPPEKSARSSEDSDAPANMIASLLKDVRPVAGSDADLRTVGPGRILVVDDNASNRGLLFRRLQRQGHTVLQAEDGAGALLLVEREPLDLILLDLMMPGISGYDVLVQLKGNARFREIPVIMISALTELDSIVRCIDAGADDYITKPFDPTLLRARVGASLERKRLHDQVVTQAADLAAWNKTLEQRVADQLAEIERAGRMRRFLSPQIADLVLSSGEDRMLESHRRPITVVFCDLRGFTAFSETTEPEEVMSVLRDYHKALGSLIHKHGGTVERFTGDGIMVFFNDPVPCPDPSLRAAHMAVEMRDQVCGLITEWRRRGFDLGLGIGIAHGYATLGSIGFEGRLDYSAIGTVVNLAARLCAEARAGQILVDPKVHAAIEPHTELEPAGELTLKGIHRPVSTFNVLSMRGRPT
jgi:adenylate cyclase